MTRSAHIVAFDRDFDSMRKDPGTALVRGHWTPNKEAA